MLDIKQSIMAAILAAATSSSMAATVYDEAADVDLSSNAASPTLIDLEVGLNTILGSVTDSTGDVRDYVTFTIEANELLTGIFIRSYTDGNGGSGNTGFHFIDDGNSSVVPTGATSGDFLGGDHLEAVDPNANQLPVLADAILAGVGFSAPLGPGDYVYEVQQTGGDLSVYEIDIEVSQVPIPAALPLFAIALTWLGWRVQKRR